MTRKEADSIKLALSVLPGYYSYGTLMKEVSSRSLEKINNLMDSFVNEKEENIEEEFEVVYGSGRYVDNCTSGPFSSKEQAEKFLTNLASRPDFIEGKIVKKEKENV